MKTLVTIILFLLIKTLLAQENGYKYRHEFSLLTENDIFFFRDYYYSAGQDITLKKLASTNSTFYNWLSINDTSKVILTYKAGIRIYTPREINQTEISKMDRPYAGYDYLSFGFTRFNNVNNGFNLSFNLGLVGSNTGLGQFQVWWHKVLQLRSPTGWSQQIGNEVVCNLNYNYWKSWRVNRSIDLVGTSFLSIGTGSNKISQDLTFRFLNFNSLKNSNFTGSILTNNNNNKTEFFFFIGTGIDYIVSNIFIEGSLFNKKDSPFVLDAIPFLFRQKLGFMYSTPKCSYSATANHLSKEVAGGIDHYYGSLDVAYRF